MTNQQKTRRKEIIKGLAEWLLAGAIFTGTIVASERTGISQAFEDYNFAVRSVAYEANERYPWIVWGNYGSPEISERRRKFDRGVNNTCLGLLGILGSAILFEAYSDKRRRDYHSK